MSFYLFYPPTNLVTVVGPVIVSGTVTANQGTNPWIVGGTVIANQGTNPWIVGGTVDIGNFPTSFGVTQGTSPWVISGSVNASQAGLWDVSVNNFPSFPTTIGVTQDTSPWVVSGTVAATQSGTWDINNISGTISLPTGAATAANQATEIASLASIDSKLNTLGQKVSAASVPVVIASDQSPIPVTGTITTSPNVNVHDGTGVSISSTGSSLNVDVTNTIPVTQSTSPWVVGGTVTANQGSPPWSVSQSGTWNIGTVTTLTSITNPVAVTQSGTWSTGRTWTLNSGTDSVTIAGTVPLPSGAATAANQVTEIASLASIDAKLLDNGAGSLFVDPEGRRTTYSASVTFTVAASATDIFTITGSATKVVRITEIGINGTNTGNTNVLTTLLKRSTANTGGTSTTPTAVVHDSSNGAATAVVRAYTANPTTGTLVGLMRSDYAFFPTLASTNAGTDITYQFGTANDKAIVLRGTSEVLVISLGGVVITGTTSVSIDLTWTEE